MSIYHKGGLVMRTSVKAYLVLLAVLLTAVFLAGCRDTSSSEDVEMIQIKYGTGECVIRINGKEADGTDKGTEYFVRMLVKVDDYAYAAPQTIDALLESLRDTKVEESQDIPTQVEVIRIDICYVDGIETALWVIYDYATEREYIVYGEKLYLMKNTVFTDSFFKPYVLNKRGDMRDDRFRHTERHIFRYIQHWHDDRSYPPLDDYKTEGFVHTTPLDEINEQVLIRRALDEWQVESSEIDWYYDNATGMWLVEIYDRPWQCARFVLFDGKGIPVEAYTMDVVRLEHSLVIDASQKVSNCGLLVNGRDLSYEAYVCMDYERESAELPLLAILKELGAEVCWNDTHTVTVTYGDKTLDFDTRDEYFGVLIPPGTTNAIRRVENNELFFDDESVRVLLRSVMEVTIRINTDYGEVRIDSVEHDETQ